MSIDATNPGEGDEAKAAEVAAADVAGDETEIENEDGEEPQPQPDDSEEIEHDGIKLKIPKAFKGAFLMQADYTRKTQELAEVRRALEERDTSLKQQAGFQQAFVEEVGTLTALDRAIEQYRQTDWPALRAQSPEQAQDRWMEYMQLQDARQTAVFQLQVKVNKRQQDGEADSARRLSDGRAILQRDIKDWSPEYAGKLTEFGAREFGFTPQEIGTITDPRLIKVLHLAYQGDAAIKKAAKAAAAAKTVETAEGVKPPAQVGNRTAQATRINLGAKDAEKLSGDEWARRRYEELRKQRA